MTNKFKHVVVSLSGGMDSSTLLLRCISEVFGEPDASSRPKGSVTALSFDYGQKHRIELQRAQQLVDYLRRAGYFIRYQVIKLDGLTDLLSSSLVTGGSEVPEGHYAQDNMKATVVPNRNKIFASITQAVALSVANDTGENVAIALGIHAGDHAIYPDCRQEFRDADEAAFRIGNWDSDKVSTYTPYLDTDKFGILQDGQKLCMDLGLDFDKVYRSTNTSYKPIYFNGDWYSDYKSASSVERIEAFIKLGRKDPVAYADEGGPVEWETAKEHVEQVLLAHAE